jgi:hypothetical protein
MRWTVARPLVALLLAVSLAACGDGEGPDGEGPTRSPTMELPSPTRSEAPEETDQAEPSQSATTEPEPSPDQPSRSDPSPGGATERPTDEASDESSEEPTEESSEPTEAPDGDEAEDDGTPTWLWWLLAVIVLGAVVAIPLLLRARRRTAWRRQLSEAEGELGWLARELLPGLRRAASREEVAGGWAVASPRVTAAEDELTVLESTAYDDGGRDRARALREASRLAGQRMAQLVAPGPHDTWVLDLDAIMADLEAALGPSRGSPT